MQISTVLWIVLAAVVSLGLVLFQYFFKAKRNRTNAILAFLRFLTLFCGFLLLINPKFTKQEYYVEKSNLIIAVDNSSSIGELGGTDSVEAVLSTIRFNAEILEKFDVDIYAFGKSITEGDSLVFDEKITDISNALSSLNEVYGTEESAMLLLTDGNQTLGSDYEFLPFDDGLKIFPLVVGDTTTYEDLRIGQVNTNKYAFLKNKFPIEANVHFTGKRNVASVFKIFVKGRQVYREQLSLNPRENNRIVNVLLDADEVGIAPIRIEVAPLEGERNIDNNKKQVAIEVIDEKTEIAIVSSIAHPDIGMLKKAMESNEQRTVEIVKPGAAIEKFDETDIFVLYQPNTSFRKIYELLQNRGGSIFTIAGTKTDWTFLNSVQSSFSKELLNQEEEILPNPNTAFTLFDISDFSMDNFPPLDAELGDILITKPYEVLGFQRIKGIDLNEPLFFVINDENTKEAVLLGENSWKWRVQSYRNERSFQSFDGFMGKLMRYLSDGANRSRLQLDYDVVYEGSTNAKVVATYFDKAYVFNPNADLTLKLRGTNSGFSREIPLLLKGNSYEADLSDLDAGDYTFSVLVKEENLSRSGGFKVLDFDLERQFLSANDSKLQRLADKTEGQLFYPSETTNLVQVLTDENSFVPIQKSNQNVVSLIDFRLLLGIMVLTLALEWFIRKYNGLL